MKEQSGLLKKSLIHTDHVLICEFDTNGSVRATQIVPIEFTPMQTIIEDVAQGLHYVNSEEGPPIIIDCYTINPQFKKFIQSIITKMFEQATTRRVEDKFKFTATTFERRTKIDSDRLHISVGPFMQSDISNKDLPVKGIILDIEEAENNKVDIEETLRTYNWAAIIVQKEKKEGYFSALSSLFKEMGTPFFIETLNNKSLKELFDFIFAIILHNDQYQS